MAGLIKLHRSGLNLREQRVVCVITGTGLKDPELAVRTFNTETVEVPSSLEEVEAALLAPTT